MLVFTMVPVNIPVGPYCNKNILLSTRKEPKNEKGQSKVMKKFSAIKNWGLGVQKIPTYETHGKLKEKT